MNPLRDSEEVVGYVPRTLAHDYRSELPEPRPTIEPITFTRRDLIEIVFGVPILASLFLGIPFLLWVVAS